MKIMVRAMGLTVIGVCISSILMHVYDLTIRYDELDRISLLAMSNTQIVMQENIEDIYYNTNNKRKEISDSNTYLNLYKDNLNTLKSTNGTYEVDGYFDPYKGLAYADITYRYNNFLGEEKTLNKKLVNIIDVVNDNEKIA